MALRFFADHCVSTTVVGTLRRTGAEVLILRDHLPTESSDPVVLAKAEELGAILVSLNGDFTDIVSYPPSQHLGIVALQIRNRPEAIPAMMKRLTDYLAAHPSMDHYEGKLLLVEAHRIRIRV